jgi:hypothetical protein
LAQVASGRTDNAMGRHFVHRQLRSKPIAAAAVLATCAGLGTTLAAGSAGAASAHAAAPAVKVSAAAPTGFWNGTDSNYIAVPGPAPYREPAIGGPYGGYIGMIGNWAAWQHCGKIVVDSATDSNDARTNLVTYHDGIGVGIYWFMAGPGVDPHYNGTTTEATAWGAAQAARVISDIGTMNPKPNYPVVWMDVELPGNAPSYTPAPDNGWNAVYTSACSGKVRAHSVAASIDRADFNGFANYLTAHSSYKAGVYSAPSIWGSIFGSGSDATISNTYEWTYNADTSSLSHHPNSWCLQGTSTCAQFFGGLTSASKYALMWQWSGGGGTYNGYGDFDQIDATRTP